MEIQLRVPRMLVSWGNWASDSCCMSLRVKSPVMVCRLEAEIDWTPIAESPTRSPSISSSWPSNETVPARSVAIAMLPVKVEQAPMDAASARAVRVLVAETEQELLWAARRVSQRFDGVAGGSAVDAYPEQH